MFKRHLLIFESSEFDTEFSELFFFLPPITDRCEEINQQMKYINTHLYDRDEKEFRDRFEPHLLDFFGGKKKKMTDSFVSVLKKIAEISVINLVKNADVLLSKRPADSEIDWA